MSEILGQETFEMLTEKFEKRLTALENQIHSKSSGSKAKSKQGKSVSAASKEIYKDLELNLSKEEEVALREIDAEQKEKKKKLGN